MKKHTLLIISILISVSILSCSKEKNTPTILHKPEEAMVTEYVSTEGDEIISKTENISISNGISSVNLACGFADSDNSKVKKVKIETNRKIIKTGQIEFRVEEIETAKKTVDLLCKETNSWYSYENLRKESYANIMELSIRIPAGRFEDFLSGLENDEFEIISKKIQAADVTKEFYDLNSRLDSKKSYLKRYREILSKANKISDILEIEEKIRYLQEEIESTEGQLRLMSNQVDFSTLTLTITKEFSYEPQKQAGFGQRVKKAFTESWRAFINFIIGLIGMWVFLLFVAIIGFFVYRKIRKQLKDKKQNN